MSLLRAAQQTDAGAVGAILTEFIDTTEWMPRVHTRAEDVAHAGMMIDRGWVTVAEDAGRVVGFVALEGSELQALYVTQGARNRGYGATLLDGVKAGQSALQLWTFQANTGAQRFYLRHGFVEVLRTEGAENDEKLPDIRYAWAREAG